MPFPWSAPIPWTAISGGGGGTGVSTFAALTDTDVTTVPPVDGQGIVWNATTMVWEPGSVASDGSLYELGGSMGPLAVGDGTLIANPVATGFTLAADKVHGVLTTPATGGPTTIEVRLEPGGTVITTGTIAAGNQIATWTPYTDVVLADGQWIETIVTAVAPTTTGQDLTVTGELYGPGGAPTGGGGPDIDSYTHTQAVAAATWTIVHGLGRVVSVRIEDGAGNDIDPDNITDVDLNTVQVDFLVAVAGTAKVT